MDVEKEKIQKQYYQIGEVAKMFNVKSSLIRFWCSEFDVLHPKKNRKGNRVFTPQDIETLKQIYYLVKEKKFTLSGAQDALKGKPDQISQNQKIHESLLKIRGFLVELKKAL